MALASVAVDWNDDQREGLPKRLPELFTLGAEQGWRVLQNLLSVFLWRKAWSSPKAFFSAIL
jgi:hypothetical protein